jgi:tetratricopeptide (TPR) repeat protein
MAKQCDVCKQTFPEHEMTCPHCGARAEPGAGAAPDTHAPASREDWMDKDTLTGLRAPGAEPPAEGSEPPHKTTQVVHRAPPQPTMLAGPGVGEDVIASGLAGSAAGGEEPPGHAPLTGRLSARGPQPTMLAKEQAEQLAAEGGAPETQTPGEGRSPKTTQLSGRQVPPTMLSKGGPDEIHPVEPGEEDEAPTAQIEGGRPGRPGSSAQIDLGQQIPTEPVPGGSSGIDLDAELPVSLGDSSSEVDLSALPKHSSRREKGQPDSGSFAEVASSDLLVEPTPSSEAMHREGAPPSTLEEGAEHEERAADALEDQAETIQAGGSGVLEEDIAGAETAEVRALAGEEAGAEAEEEEAARPMKAAKRGGLLVGGAVGAVGGAVVAAAACLGLSFMGLLPGKEAEKPARQPLLAQDGDKKPSKEKPGTDTETPQKAAARLLALPDVKAARTSLEKYEGDDPETLTQRAELTWLAYLGETKGQPKADAEAIQKVKQDLSKVKSARATFLLGQVEEDIGKTEEAREIYRKGIQTYPDDKEIFQSALDHLDSRRAAKKAAGAGARAPRPGVDQEAQARLILLLLALQGAPAEKTAGEAGFKVWEALRLANKDGNYEDAVKALDEAVKRHEERRYANLRRGLNPVSDPKEEIFVRAAEEVKAYWQLLSVLKANKYDTSDPIKAFETLATEKKASDQTLKELSDALAQAKLIKDGDKVDAKVVAKELATLVAAKTTAEKEKKTADDALTAAFDLLKPGKFVAEDEAPAKGVPAGVQKVLDAKKTCDTKLDDVNKQLGAVGIKDADAAKGIERLAALKKDFEDVAKKLKPQYLDQEKTDALNPADRAAVLGGVDKVKEAVPLPVQEAMAKLTALESRLRQAHTPQQMIDLWAPLLQQDRSRKDVAAEAARDGKMVAEDPKSTPELKAKARYVEGLALRNEGKFEDARKALQAAVTGGAKGDSAGRALAELLDPATYYLPRPRELMARGNYRQALVVVDQGLSPELFPDNGRLLALRSLLRLGLAREEAQGKKLTDNSPGLKEARADAKQALEAAAKAKDAIVLADAHYAMGRLDEELGKWDDAQKNFDAALGALEKEKPGPARNAALGRAEVAKARVLLRLRQGVPATAEENKPAAPAPAKPDKAVRARTRQLPFLLASNTVPVKQQLPARDYATVSDVPPVFFAAPWVRQLPTTGPELKRDGLSTAEVQRRAGEAVRLADAAIKDGDKEGYLLKAQALAARNEWTEALKLYVEGLREIVRSPTYPARYGADLNGLKYLVDNNPALLGPGAALPGEREPIPDEVLETSQAAEKLGERLIAAGDPQGYLIQGMALAQRGQWKDGLKSYVIGLQKFLRPAAYGNGLRFLVDHHPAFQRPDGIVPPNPAEAKRRYGEGLAQYWAGDYAGAESKLLDAIHQDDRDARFYYYLGLSRLPQAGKRDAALDDLRMAGLLERQKKPGTAAVGLALERVQGPARTLINEKASRLPPRSARAE